MANGPLGAVLDHLCRLFDGAETVPAENDELLHRFVRTRDETAFAALVKRHAALVWKVCRGILHSQHDAEDAFQATFLVLARKAGSIAQPHLLGPWLHGVAYRVAQRVRTQAARRRHHERQTPMPLPATSPEIDWRELGPILEEEIHRLPEKYRVPFVLCHLEGQTNEQAAAGCPKGPQRGCVRGRRRSGPPRQPCDVPQELATATLLCLVIVGIGAGVWAHVGARNPANREAPTPEPAAVHNHDSRR
jgi:RNA polymerase sigma factor (sigma-70 family)